MKLARRKFLELFGKGIPAVIVADRLFPKVTKPEPEPELTPEPMEKVWNTAWDGDMTSWYGQLPIFEAGVLPEPTMRQTRFDI